MYYLLLSLFLSISLLSSLNNRPIIGIITEPTDSLPLSSYGTSLINSDYVKWIEASGARVIPIPFDSPIDQLDYLFNNLNGIVYPGGPDILNGTLYYKAAKYLFDKAIESNKNGIYYPVWGTCLGFEFLSLAIANDDINILTHFDAENISLPLTFTDYAINSRMFNYQSVANKLSQMDYLSEYNATENFHHYGVSPEVFATELFSDFYNVIATSLDRNNLPFVSAVEAKDFPIYGVQFHPERSLFEWNPTEQINHSSNSVDMAQYFSRFFVSECRKNLNHFDTDKEAMSLLIENTPATFTYFQIGTSMEYYFFDSKSAATSSN